MHVALVYPPAAEIRQPYPALPALAAYLRRTTACRVTLEDANLAAFHHFTSPERLRQATERLHRELALLEERQELDYAGQRRYLEILNVVFEGPSVSRRIAEAKETMRHRRRFLDPESYHDAVMLINRALQLISAEHPPAAYDTFGFRLDGRETTVEGLLAAAADPRVNPFLDYFRAETVPRLLAGRPGLVGLSIGYIDQLLPAMTLARLLRQAAGPGLGLVAGGAVLLELEDVLLAEPALYGSLDGFILHDGEEPLRRLVEALPGGRLDEVPNLIRLVEGRPAANPMECRAPLESYPTPAYDLLPLDRYLTPEVVYHLQSSRGCYWNRCAFCTRPVTTPDRNFRKRPAARVLADVDHLRRTVGARAFAFYDDSVPPATLGAIADHLAVADPGCCWYAEVKFEPVYTREFLARLKAGGCRMLFFGLESASPPLLQRMDKGLDVAVAGRILEDCAALALPAVLGWFVGFPGETVEEHRQTLEFIERHRAAVVKADALQFTLYRHSKVYLDPGRYGVTRTLAAGRGPLALSADYEVAPGSITAEEAGLLARQAAARLARLGLMEPRSESHLFLAVAWSERGAVPERSRERFLGLRPRLVGELEERRLAFPLEEIIRRLRTAERRLEKLARLRGPEHRRELEEEVGAAAPAVRRGPYVYQLHRPSESKLVERELRVLRLCDGRTPVREILASLAAASPPVPLDHAYPVLSEALRKGVLELA